jgi:hypothetical protein
MLTSQKSWRQCKLGPVLILLGNFYVGKSVNCRIFFPTFTFMALLVSYFFIFPSLGTGSVFFVMNCSSVFGKSGGKTGGSEFEVLTGVRFPGVDDIKPLLMSTRGV